MRLLFIILALGAGSSLAPAFAEDCAVFWERGFPALPPAAAFSCDRHQPPGAASIEPHKMFVASAIAHDPEVKAQMDIVRRALITSVAVYQAKAPVPDIVLVRHDAPHFSDPNAFAFTFTEFALGDEPCPVIVYPHSMTLTRSELEQVIAHEVFHCVQKLNFKEQVTAAVAHGAPGLWWFEGVAQYFSNLAFPTNDFEYTARFAAPNTQFPFFDERNPYSTENFWQAYANHVDVGGIFNAQGVMPLDGSTPKPKAAADLPLISEALHQYGRDISMGRVRDTGGHYAPYRARFLSVAASDDPEQEITLEFKDFAVGAHRITLPPQRIWRLSLADAPAGTKASIKKGGESEYIDFTAVFQTASRCDEEAAVEIVLTRVDEFPGDSAAVIRISREDNPECKCDNPAARREASLPACVVGTWTVPYEVVQHPSKFSGAVAGATSALNAFDYTLEIRADKTYSETLTYENESRGPSVMKPGETVSMNQQVTATSSGQVCVLSGDRLEFIGEQHIVQRLMMSGYQGTNSGGRDLGPSDIRSTREYYCGEGASEVEPPFAYPVNIDYLKARGF